MTLESGITSNYYEDEVAVQNANAIRSPALGFTFDMSSVSDKIAACQSIFEGYKAILFTGTAEPESTVKEMMSAMRASGFDDIIAEAQSQLDAFLAK